MTSNMVFPNLAGESATTIPADFKAAILSSAPPFPPLIIAPACPIRRPGGAVLPAMYPTTGFPNKIINYVKQLTINYQLGFSSNSQQLLLQQNHQFHQSK